mmetsp:Transcript_77909/g.215332  ORF Transcript_77909/g.215332 Transcript_77909/m.215332 type:complete len:251 (-) Transcript_77909:554-1306(-)
MLCGSRSPALPANRAHTMVRPWPGSLSAASHGRHSGVRAPPQPPLALHPQKSATSPCRPSRIPCWCLCLRVSVPLSLCLCVPASVPQCISASRPGQPLVGPRPTPPESQAPAGQPTSAGADLAAHRQRRAVGLPRGPAQGQRRRAQALLARANSPRSAPALTSAAAPSRPLQSCRLRCRRGAQTAAAVARGPQRRGRRAQRLCRRRAPPPPSPARCLRAPGRPQPKSRACRRPCRQPRPGGGSARCRTRP